jgi:hypothetical protein
MVKTGAQNVINDDNFGTEIPVTMVDDTQLNAEKKMAKYSKSKEYQQLKTYLESRIDFFQKFLPDGTAIAKQEDLEQSIINWKVANVVIAEFKAVLDSYDAAREAVTNAERT